MTDHDDLEAPSALSTQDRPARSLARRLLPAAALVATLLAPACHTTRYKPEWSAGELSAPSERILWQVTVMALEKHKFPIGADIDPVAMEAISGWRNQLQPFRRQGYRERAHVRYSHVGGGDYEVEVRVEHEVNTELAKPLDLQYAKWEEAPDDTEEARVILQRIKAYMGGEFEVSPKERMPWE
jgi:hypothetical protein